MKINWDMNPMNIFINTERLLVQCTSQMWKSSTVVIIQRMVVQFTSRQQKGDSIEKLFDNYEKVKMKPQFKVQ